MASSLHIRRKHVRSVLGMGWLLSIDNFAAVLPALWPFVSVERLAPAANHVSGHCEISIQRFMPLVMLFLVLNPSAPFRRALHP